MQCRIVLDHKNHFEHHMAPELERTTLSVSVYYHVEPCTRKHPEHHYYYLMRR